MSTLASQIITRALIVLQDVDAVRWSFAELYEWVYDAQLAIVLAKPSALAASVAIEMQSGTLQKLAAPDHLSLLRVTRNLQGPAEARTGGRAVRPTTRDILDTTAPDWHFASPKAEVRQIVFDEACPREFYVYPANNGSGVVEAVVALTPVMPAITGDATAIESYAVPLALPEIYMLPVLDFALYRAYSKDAAGADAGRATFHYQQFATAVGIKIQVESGTSPNVRAGVTAS